MSGHQEYKCPECAYEYESPERFSCPVCNRPAPDVLTELRYITQSPSREHGGFHEQTVATAQNAVEEIKRLRAENTTLRRMLARKQKP